MGMTKQQREALETRLTAVITAEPDLTTRQLTERFHCGAHIIQRIRKKLGVANPGASELLNKQDISKSRVPELVKCSPMRVHYRRFE
jgi:hypothetical protein